MADPNPAAHPARLCRLEPIAIDAPASLSDFAMSVPDAGAIMSFTGQVRPFREGVAVSHLHLQAHDTLTKALMTERLDWACGHWSLDGGSMIHRIGDVARGDTIVLVATASAHRRAAFKAADYLMDYLKTEALLWKCEYTAEGRHWVEPRAQDMSDRQRWVAKTEDSS